MAYGNGNNRRNWVMKALPLAVGDITAAKQAELIKLFDLTLDLMRTMSAQCFIQEPLDRSADNDIEKRLIAIQKADATLNKVWAEQARMRVKPALEESYNRYFKRLVGCLRHVDGKIPEEKLTAKQEKALKKFLSEFVGPMPPRRKYWNVPLDIQDAVSGEELDALKAIAESKKAIELFERVIIGKDEAGLTTHQVAILKSIHRCAQEKHHAPDFGVSSGFTLQLHIDYRMLPKIGGVSIDEAQMLRAGEAYLLKDDENTCYRRFLDISGVAPHAKRIRVPVALNQKLAKRLESTEKDYAALILELTRSDMSQLKVEARLVCGKPKPAPILDLSAVTKVVSRDYGYTNTICLAIIESETPIDLTKAHEAFTIATKEETKAFLEAHVLPEDVRTLDRIQFSGQNFLKKIETLCLKIDSYTSRIDTAYNELMVIKGDIFALLNLSGDDLILPDHKQSAASDLAKAFFAKFGLINDLKKARRKTYEKIAGIKKAWFGYLSNKEIELARLHGAVIVREDFTVEATEKDKPDYKGVRFNKMTNNGSKGQYQNKASDKMTWNCVPEFVIGAWYTSRYCAQHGTVIERKHRQGESIFLPCCQRHDHADLHASETIGRYLFLRPKLLDSAKASNRDKTLQA